MFLLSYVNYLHVTSIITTSPRINNIHSNVENLIVLIIDSRKVHSLDNVWAQIQTNPLNE